MIVRRTYKLSSKLEHFCEIKGALLIITLRICLEAQWLRIHLLCRGHGFDPWSVRIPHVLCGGGGLHNSACVPQLLSPRAATPEARALQQESNPHSPHLEKVHAQPKMNKINQLKNNDTETTGVNGRSPPLGK